MPRFFIDLGLPNACTWWRGTEFRSIAGALHAGRISCRAHPASLAAARRSRRARPHRLPDAILRIAWRHGSLIRRPRGCPAPWPAIAICQSTPGAVSHTPIACAHIAIGGSIKVGGRCHCGAITYEADVHPARVMVCHCTDCQRSASLTVTNAPQRS
jgi:hypothetical protein